MSKQNMHPEDIKTAIRKSGLSLSELARRNGLHVSTVVMAPMRLQPAGNRAIAKHLGKTLNEIWPEWFDAHGNPITSRQPSRKPRAAASQNAAGN